MLQLDNVCKSYTTNDFTQIALDNVSLAFRDNEFVSILGPSGSGKTTMLNVIGGLDHFDSGDLLIDGISTKEYQDRDWDTYRNNRIGFVFQSYNLIPHQTILANVELALTLSGVNAAERRERAREALAKVGLGEHVDKRPSQLSGGQMQRVAIARALINDPEILLADEPTGALDSKTSVQVMDLLREVASDRLVIMVTHNPELARQYSTRIVELADGKIRSDTDPFVPTKEDLRDAKPARRTSMSFGTALSLSFNNLMTKKGRTLMTAFAGSIGIIGIAAILALANGVNAYIQEVEEDTLSVYPLQIMSSGFDMTSMFLGMSGQTNTDESNDGAQAEEATQQHPDGDRPEEGIREARIVTNMFGSVGQNDLASLKEYIDGNNDNFLSYVQDIEYKYGLVPQIFSEDSSGEAHQVNPDNSFAALGLDSSSSKLFSSSSFNTNVFSQMPSDLGLVEEQFDVKAGRWPTQYDELVVVASKRGALTDFMSYAMGLRDHDELAEMVQRFADQEEVEAPTDSRTYTYDQIMGVTFKVIPAAQFYVYENEYDVWASKIDDNDYIRGLLKTAQKLKIVGIVQPKEDVDATSLSMGIYYTPKLTTWLMQQAADAKVVKEQLANPRMNVLSGKTFEQEAKREHRGFDMGSLFTVDESKIANAFKFDESKLNLSDMDLTGLDLSSLAGALDLSSLAGSMDPSAFDLSSIDLSALDLDSAFSSVDLSSFQFDLSVFDLSGIDMSTLFDQEFLELVDATVPRIDVTKVFEGTSPVIDQTKLAQAMTGVQEGLRAHLAAHPVSPRDSQAVFRTVVDYFSQPDVSQAFAASMRDAIQFREVDRKIIQSNLRSMFLEAGKTLRPEQLERLGQGAERLANKLADQIGEQVSSQMASTLSTQLGTALGTALGNVMETVFAQTMQSYLSAIATTLQEQIGNAMAKTMEQSMTKVMESLMRNMGDAMSVDQQAFAEAFSMNMDEKELGQVLMAMLSTERTSYEANLSKLGYAEESKPSQIDIYPNNFEDKARVLDILDAYNDRMRTQGEEEKVITYTDIVGALMTSVTDIVNMISYVLIAFVAISLIVSSIMIGVITYISVLERKKEIGILRSIGASKRDVSNVFNAETVIEGLVSGIMGVSITALITIPANYIVETNLGVDRVARLPVNAAIILIAISVFLSFIAGVLPARKAAKADPVEALRSE